LVQALQSKVEGLSCSLSWLGTGTSIKSGGAKPLIFLAWYRHFNQKFLLKCLYQARKMSGLAPPLLIEVPVPSQESEQFNPSTFD
jgi:hypothetical protein